MQGEQTNGPNVDKSNRESEEKASVETQLDPIAGLSRDATDAQMHSLSLSAVQSRLKTDRAVYAHVRCQKTFVYSGVISSCQWTGTELYFRAARLQTWYLVQMFCSKI